MEKRYIGYTLLILAILFLISIVIFQLQVNNLLDAIMTTSGGSCFTEAGECIHEQSSAPFVLGLISVIILFLFSGLLIFWNKIFSKELIEKDNKENGFEYLLKALNEDEKKVIQEIKKQDGISQFTLGLRTDIHKSKLSLILASLEKKNLIKKVKKGKINRIYLKIKI